MQKVMIPSSANPFVIYVNGMNYTYPAGTIQEVPDDVAIIIERYQEDRNKEPEPVNPPFNCCGDETGGGIPIPETAEVCQTIVVKAVDENGKPTEWEATDAFKKDEYVVILNKVFEEDTPTGTPWGGEYYMSPDCHWWDRSFDGEFYKLETIKVLIHVPATTSPTNGKLFVFVGRDKDPNAGNLAWLGTSPVWDNNSFPGTSERWLRYEYDLRNKNATFVNVATTSPVWARTTPSDHVGCEKLWANTKWLKGVAIQFYGTMPAGTELFIYGKKVNENNPLPPAWEVSE